MGWEGVFGASKDYLRRAILLCIMTPTSQSNRYTAEEVASLGDELYENRIRTEVEADSQGKVVAIDVMSGQYVIDETALQGCKRLLAKSSDAEIWCVRVGHRALYHIGARSLRESV